METCTVISIHKVKDGKNNVMLKVMVGDIEKHLGPFPAVLVCDLQVADRFTWNGENISTLYNLGPSLGAEHFDVLVEVGGIYGDGIVNVTARKGVEIRVIDYDTMDGNEIVAHENEAIEIRDSFLLPAPVPKTDWAAEYDRILELRGKAILFLRELAATDYSEDFCHRQDSAFLIKSAAMEQKALAGRANP